MKTKTKNNSWLNNLLIYTIAIGCYGFYATSAMAAESNWSAADLGSYANFSYKEENFTASLGDKLANKPDTLTFQVKNPQEGKSWFNDIWTEDYKTLTLTLVDAQEVSNLPTETVENNIEQKTQEIDKERDSLVNKVTGLFETNDARNEFVKIDENQLKNIDAIDDVDSEYNIWPDYGVKENLIVKGTNGKAINTFYYQLKLDDNVQYFSTNDANPFDLPADTYYFTDEDGNYLAHFLPILVYDSNHNQADQVQFEISRAADGQTLQIKIQVDYAWMIDNARQYPVIIDPTIVHNTPADFGAGRALNRMALADGKVSIAQMPPAKNINTVGLWHMDETTGNNIADSSGNNNTGTASGTTIVDGKFGKARSFNGVSDAIDLGTSDLVDGPMTIEYWYNTSSTGNNALLELKMDNLGFVSYKDSSGRIMCGHRGTLQAYTPNNSFPLYSWNHVALVYNGGLKSNLDSYKIYINGVNQTLSLPYGNMGGSFSRNYIGRESSGAFTSGLIDEIKLTSKILTPEQIKTDAQNRPYGVYDSSVLDLGADFSKYDKISWGEQGVQTGNGETPYSTDGLVAQWNFNETSGTTLYNNDGTCGAACNGTLINMTSTGQDASTNSGWTANNKRWGSGALMFDGSDDYVNVTQNTNLNLADEITITGWIYQNQTDTTDRDIISKGGNENAMGWMPTNYAVRLYDGALRFFFGTSNSATYYRTFSAPYKSLKPGQWNHFAITYKSGDINSCKIFINGQSQTVEIGGTGSASLPTNTYDLRLGKQSSVNTSYYALNGAMDAMQLFNRSLTADEILSNYQAGNIEILTRSGETTNPDDGSWDNWKPSGNGTEITLDNVDNNNEANRDTNTKLLIHGDGDNNSTKFFDNSYNKYQLTSAGDVKTKTDQSKFGGSSMYFDGNGDYLQMAYNSDLDLGSKWTIDFWVYPTSTSTAKFLSTRGSSGDGWEISYWGNFVLEGFGSNSGAGVTTGTYPINNWYHIAVVTNNGASKMYVNGQETFSVTNNFSWGAGSHPLRIGLPVPYNEPMNGFLDEIRISKGVARWTANFTPPTSAYNNDSWITTNNDTVVKNEGTSAMKISQCSAQSDANTVALWHLDETGGSGDYIKDSSGNNNNGTPTGTSVVDGVSGKGRYFNGTSDYVSIPDNENFNITSTDGGFDVWANPYSYNITQNYARFLAQENGVGGNWLTYFRSNNFCVGVWGATELCSSGITLNTNNWYYIAVYKSNGTTKIYINGIERASGTGAYFNNSSLPLTIGKAESNYLFNGVIDELRFMKSRSMSADEIAEAYRLGRDHRITNTFSNNQDLSNSSKIVYNVASDKTGNYLETTIGESAFANNEPDANTIGLWHLEEATGSGAYLKDSSSYGNNGTPTNSAQTSGKIGKGRYFDGSGDYITVSDNSSLDMVNDFSISWWQNTTSSSGYSIVKHASNYGIYSYADGSIDLYAPYSSNWIRFSAQPALIDGLWHYITVTRQGTGTNNVKYYVDGFLKNQGTLLGTLDNTGNLYIGSDGSTSFNGSLDEVRIDNVARSALEIRQAYEIGKRTHAVTIDFAAILDSENLISNNSDNSFTIDATKKGLSQKGANLFVGDKVIIKENYNGTEYIAQGLVDSIDVATGAVTVSSWDGASTFPTVGFSVNADVFKWQKEYWDLTGIMDDQIDTANRITVRLTDGSEGRNIWLDDFKSVSNYLTDPSGSLLNSNPNRFIQYRVLSSTTDTNVSPTFSSVTVKRPPTIDENNETILAVNEGLNRTELTTEPIIKLKNMSAANDPYLVGHWKMDEISGTTVADSSGNGNNGTASGTSITDGAMGKARVFNGTNDVVAITDNPAMNFERTSQFSIDGWVKFNSLTGYENIIAKTDTVYKGWTLMKLASSDPNRPSSICLLLTNTNATNDMFGCTPSNSIQANILYHFAVTYDGSSKSAGVKIYFNGIPQTITPIRDGLTASIQNSGPTYIGKHNYSGGNYYLNGMIDELSLYSRMITIEEIQAHYKKRPYGTYTSKVLDLINNPQLNSLTWSELGVQTGSGETPKDATGLVAQWNFNETSGTTATSNAGSCGTACNGTLTNMTTTGQDASVSSGWTVNNKKWGAGAVMFDGNNDYINSENNSGISGNPTFSIEAWFRPNIIADMGIIGFGDGNTSLAAGSMFIGSNGSLVLSTAGLNNATTNAGIIKAGQWYHAVIVKTPGAINSTTKIYINGKEYPVSGSSSTPNITNLPVNIGKFSNYNGYYFNGVIDTTKIYSRALTADEIQSNYQVGNIEFQTRSGATGDPNDGSWEEWRPAGSGTDTTLVNNENDSVNWSWDNVATFMPKSKSDDSVVRLNGNTSTKLQTGILQSDANTVALWHLDETGGSGAYIKDSSGNNNNGTPSGASLVDGISGKARNFNGTLSDYIDLGNKLGISGASSKITIEAWIYPTTNTDANYIINRDNNYFLMTNSAGKVVFSQTDDGNLYHNVWNSTNTITLNTWNHIVVTYNGGSSAGSGVIYINGVANTTNIAYHGSWTNTGSNCRIGSRAANGSFTGKIDEVRISNIARTSEEIAEAYRAGANHRLTRSLTSSQDLSNNTKLPFAVAADKTGTYLQATVGESAFANYEADANTVGLWHLEEATGSGAYIKDSSNSSNNGTPTGTTLVDGKIGKGRSFNGSSEYISIPTSNSLNLGVNAATIDMFLKSSYTGSTQQTILHKYNNGSGYGYLAYLANSKVTYFPYWGGAAITSNTTVADNNWHHLAFVRNGTDIKIYIDGKLDNIASLAVSNSDNSINIQIGQNYGQGNNFTGHLDEIRISNIARTPEEIRQTYEVGARTHTVTFDFSAGLDSSNLISSSADTSFVIDATRKGLSYKAENLFTGDKIIIRENYDGTEYVAQGVVNGVDQTTGAVTVSAWDSGSTFPSAGYSINADVFKWQTEFWDLSGVRNEDKNAVNKITMRITDGVAGRNIWLDDFKASTNYLTDPTASIMNSTSNQYLQYRAILTSNDTQFTPAFNNVSLDYDTQETVSMTSASTTATYLNNVNKHEFPITCHGVTANEPDLTITCQASFDQSHWYDVTNSNSPLSSSDLTGNVDVVDWNSYPSSDGILTIFARVSDGTNASDNVSFTVDKDTIDPTINSITSVDGNTATPYFDNTDDGSTEIIFAGSPDANSCRWDETDITFSAMANNCTNTSSCNINLTGQGTNTVYLRCDDTAGNIMNTSQAVTYTIDSIAPTTPPTCTPIDNTYFKDSLSVICTTGEGGDLIKYTSNDASPTISSDQWFDTNISATSNFKLISCDNAGNCLDAFSQYRYNLDNIPPGVPTMNNEPQYSAGTNNIVSSNTVSDSGVGGVEYEFCSSIYEAGGNMALNKTATASAGNPDLAVDGNTGSIFTVGNWNDSWIQIDLGTERTFDQIKLLRSYNDGRAIYNIQGSNDGVNFTTFFNFDGNIGGNITNTFEPVTYRYVRFNEDQWPTYFWTYELEIYHNGPECLAQSDWQNNTSYTFSNLTDSTKYYYYVHNRDSLNNISDWSTSVNSIQDNVPPSITSINSVAGDTLAPFADKTDDGQTIVNFSGSADIADCFWDNNDVAYEEMANLCATTSSCTLDAAGEGDKTAFIRCADIAGNIMNSSYVLNYAVDTIAPTTAPTCTPNDNTYFYNELVASCATGFGGTTIRYTNNNNEPSDTSPLWETDQTITATTTFKLISCDDANNCYLTPSVYNYLKDITPPPVPTINSEPTYTAGTTNTINSNSVSDAGAGGVGYQFCINTVDNTNDCTSSDWLTTNSYTFANLIHGTRYYYFVRSKDSLNNTSNWSSSTFSTQDNIVPAITSITDIASDNTSPYLDSTDNGETTAHFVSSPDTTSCKWATVDVNYDLMIHTCESTGSCTFNLSGPSTKNIYLRCMDQAENKMGNSTLFMYDIDIIPTINSIAYVEDDSAAPYFDLTDNGNTSIIFGTSNDAVACRWDVNDTSYDNMTNDCSSTDECTANLTGQGNKTVYLRCIDGQNQSTVNSFTVNYAIDSIAPTAAPTCTPESQIFGGTIAVACSPGAGADLIRYTINPNDVADGSSDIWSDQSFSTTAQLQVISCDNANNCFPQPTIYDYTKDSTPPPTPVMMTEPMYTRGTSNTVRSSTVIDSGIGGAIEYQFGWNHAGGHGMLAMSDWSVDPEALFGPLDDNTYYFFVRARDVLGNTSGWSAPVSSTQDNQAATLTAINSVAGDTTPNEWGDNTDDAYTDVRYTADPDVSDCKWSEADQSYTAMANTCNSVNRCILNLTGEGEHNIYLRCADKAGNADAVSYNLKYFIDTAPPTGKPTCSATGLINNYFSAGVNVSCLPGEGGDEVRYTINNNDPTWESILWTNQSFHQTTTLKAISCDWANNCYDEIETNIYTQDLVPPPLPTMVGEPSYTFGLSNTVQATAVNDVLPGVGLISYQFQIKYFGDTNWVTNVTDWLNEPEYTFTNLTHNQTYYYAVRAKDGLENLPADNAWSGEVSSTQDNNYPIVTMVNYVVEDYDQPYVDETDDSNTLIGYTTSDSPTSCRWSQTDKAYAEMENTCENTSNCTLNLNTVGDKTVYMRCIDAANNTSPESYQLNYRVDPDGDGRPPLITGITSVAGDVTSPYFDTTDNNATNVIYTATSDATICRWGTSDAVYNNLPNTCTDTSNCDLNLAGNGGKTVYMRCIDGAGNRQRTSRVLNYNIDSLAPAVNIVSVAGDDTSPYYDTTDNNDAVTNILVTDNLAGVQNCRWDETDQSYTAMAHNCESNSQCNLSEFSGESGHTGYIRCIDNVDNAMSTSLAVNFTIDETEPVIENIVSVAGNTSLPYYDQTNNTDTSVEFSSSDNLSGVQDCRWSTYDTSYDNMYSGSDPLISYRSCSNSNCNVGSDYLRNSFWGEGQHSLFLRCRDVAGNRMSNSYQVDLTIDSIPPSVNSIISVESDLTSPFFDYTNDNNTLIKYTASDNVLGIAGCKWDTNNVGYESMANSCDINNSTCLVNESGQGWHDVYLKCIDLAGNINSYPSYYFTGAFDENIMVPALQALYYVDTDAPNIVIDSVNGNTNSAHYNDNTDNAETEIRLHQVTALDSNTMAEDATECKWDSEEKNYEDMTHTCASTNSCTADLTGEGEKTVYIRCIDLQNNITTSKKVDYKIDLTVPSINSLTSVAGDTSAPYYDTKPDDVYINGGWRNITLADFVANDNLSGVYNCRWDTSETEYSNMGHDCASTNSCAIDLDTQGTHNIFVRCTDWAGNPMTSSLAFEYTYDTQGPIMSINSVENDLTAPYFDYTDNGDTDINFNVDDATLGVANCKWNPSSTTYSLMNNLCDTLGLCQFNMQGEESHTGYIGCVDQGGNTTMQSVPYWIDTRPPIVTEITSVAGDTTANDYNDNTDNGDTLVIFKTLAEDTAECKWSANNLAYDSMNNTCEGTDRCRLNLRGNGSKTAYIRCKDLQNKKAIAPYVLNYNVDSAPPNINSIIQVASDYTAPYFDPNSDFVTPIGFSSSDNVSGVESCKFHFGNPNNTYSCDSTNLCTVREFVGISNRYGAHTAYLKCKDYAQNEMADYYPVSYTTDYRGPDISLISVAEDTTAPYYDTSDDGNTITKIETSDLIGASSCRWGVNPDPEHILEYKPDYNQLENVCESTEQCTLHLMGQGTKTIYMRCVDYLNYQTGSDTTGNPPFVFSYTIDSSSDGTPPTINKINSVAGDTTTVYHDNTDDGLSVVSYQASGDTNTCKWDTTNLSYDNLTHTCESTNTCSLNLAGEGTKKVYFKCIDNAGNKAIMPYTLRYTIDTTPPTITDVVTLAADPSTPYIDNTDDNQTSLLYRASSDATSCKWSTSNQSYAAMPNSCTSTNQCNFDLNGWGEKTVYLRCIDGASNAANTSFMLNYTLDPLADGTPPVITGIQSVADDTSAPYYDSSDNSSTEVLFTAEPDTLQCKWNTLDVNYDQMQNFCESTNTCTLNVSGRGAKTVYMRCMDNAGNAAINSYVLDYIIETMTPRITAINSVAGDDQYTYLDPTDDSQTLVEYETSDGTTECKWDSIDTNYDNMSNTCQNTERCLLNLTGPGNHKVYLRCKNAANIKSDVSFKLLYDIEQPVMDGNASAITAQLNNSTPNHQNVMTVYYDNKLNSTVTNGSIKLLLSDEFDLSSLTKDDVRASGGDVEWTNNETITSAGTQIAQSSSIFDKISSAIWRPQIALADGENSIIFPYLGDLSATDGNMQFIIGNANKISNPITPGTYGVTLEIHDQTGEIIESREALVAISEEVNVTASIPSSLTFAIDPVATGTVNNSTITTPTLTGNSVDFGIYATAENRIAAHDLVVSTNAANGYLITTQYSGTMSGTAGNITDFIGTNANPESWSYPSGPGVESYFGYTTSDYSLPQNPSNRFEDDKWAAFSTTPAEVVSETQSVDNQITRVGYRMQITDKQPAGFYQTSIMYICTPTY